MDVDLPMPGRAGPRPATSATRYQVDVGGPVSLWAFDVGLACCAVELDAAVAGHPETFRPVPPGDAVAGPAVMVVSGTVTDKMAPAVHRLFQQLPEPRYVVSFGSCSNSGGPYWDSYSVTKGIDQLVPVDVYVPGCPPRPEALLHGLRTLLDDPRVTS
ncbi:MAG: NADH-quinone oxidoreductase subunit NuoB [Nocardioidaceae bacterium]